MRTPTAAIFCALILGLSWAVRGHFGHEWGAAWAGAAGAMAVLVATGRADWFRRLPALAALGAVGWGAGGMMSYGIVVGYCRADTFLNSLYGYAMLAVIGGLYGFLGGGLLGLGLESSDARKPNWFVLLSGMVSAGCLFWGIVIYQLEWLMTPPRSEAWALCAGAAIALAWYAYQENFHRALRVAAYAALGGGFGFAIGNFFQTAGTISGVSYNWWNVMEFTLGFFGGLGMAYAVSTTEWPEAAKPSRAANWIGLLFLTLLLPWSNYVNAFEGKKLMALAKGLGVEDVARFVSHQQTLGLTLVALVAIGACFNWKWHQHRDDRSFRRLGSFVLFAYTLYYVVFGFIVKGFFYRSLSLGSSDTLYLPILMAAATLWLFSGRGQVEAVATKDAPALGSGFIVLALMALAAIVMAAAMTVAIHDGKIRFHERFAEMSFLTVSGSPTECRGLGFTCRGLGFTVPWPFHGVSP